MVTMTSDLILDYYRRPGSMTAPGDHIAAFEALPADIPALIQTVQGLILHEHWAPYYGQSLSDERRSEVHMRRTAAILDRLRDGDGLPVTAPRTLEHRVVGNCRDFSVLLVAMLRAKNIPARARCGFGSYFMPGTFEDHWVAEYWNDEQARWILVDAQIDTFQRDLMQLDFDTLDVPRDRFIVAGDAWTQFRTGGADANAYGIGEMRGAWFIAGNVLRDLAALNNMEMLPWDVWGPMPEPDEPVEDTRLALFDRIATATLEPDANISLLRELYADERLQVPSTVFNAILNQTEEV